MAIHMLLTDIQIRRATAQDKAYTLNDGNGLSLLIKPNGSEDKYDVQ
ncbi:phage integrase family site specific recombinase [Yersinia enterocolitica]|uniref:Phage integrase family site specific recombinase n=2 Tax=Yersinia enterocolitica TaxID=630 RepID=A0A0H5G5Z3_YEREN|nr:phage integrase family site specific recombinase [Yersinia enterocolitica]CNB57434.1 phage integrase family site specific recombinase [Yersinia enterocolitica]CNC28992.1 phage integrase family site specific recombinase [Yersinia enterocolitica]CNC46173.1 phage integrase family site specific recombinase [Yersinia enterocolitica]CNC61640.1 phage integrase family site specific recombinase [Yersinia enterocolitica]